MTTTVGEQQRSSTSWVTISTVLRCVSHNAIKLVLQLHPGERIEQRERLVQSKRRGSSARPGDSHTLLHPAESSRGITLALPAEAAARVRLGHRASRRTPDCSSASLTLSRTVSHGSRVAD